MQIALIEDRNLLRSAKAEAKTGHAVPFEYNGRKFFLKVCRRDLLKREIDGYGSCREFYPVPKMEGFFKDETSGYLIYEYESTIGKDKGLLVDLFSNNTANRESLEKIISMYESAFEQSLTKNVGHAADIFFKDRIPTRLEVFYDQEFLKKAFDFTFNGRKISIALQQYVDEIQSFFSHENEKWCVVSQCDANDLNIGTKPVLFDFTAGGHVPLWAEFATLFWYQLAQGSYLSLKYNANAFRGHERIFDTADSVLLEKDSLAHIPAQSRIEFVKVYIERVISPLWDRVKDDLWYEQFKYYAAMKILCVFDVSKMEQADQLLSLGYLEAIFNLTPTHPRDLINLFMHERQSPSWP